MIRVLRYRILPAAVAVLALAAVTAQATAKPPLSDVPEIEDPLFWVAVAHEVTKQCPSISARYFKGFATLSELRRRANELGYSDAEIKAYVESPQQKARMRAKGEAFLADHGVTYDNLETFCVFGRAEIEKSSAIGVLLRAK